MLIPVIGSQGCGKSTLITQLISANNFKKIESQVARNTLHKMGFTLQQIYADPKLTVQFQLLTLAQKKLDEQQYVDDRILWLVERSYLDLAAYTVANLGRFDHLTTFLNEYVEECMELHGSTYSHSIKIVGGLFDVLQDGTRPINPHYASMIESYLNTLLLPHSDNTLIISTKNIDDRVHNVHQYFSPFLSNTEKV